MTVMARKLRMICFVSLIVSAAIFGYTNIWLCCDNGSVGNDGTRRANASVLLQRDDRPENVVESSYDLTVKRTLELIIARLKAINDTLRYRRSRLVDNQLRSNNKKYRNNNTNDDDARDSSSISSSSGTAVRQSNLVTAKPPFHHAPDAVPTWRNDSIRTLTVTGIPIVNVTAVNCGALFQRDKRELEKAADFQTAYPKIPVPPMRYIQQASNCTQFVNRRHYATSPVNAEEAEFRIAFSILMFKDVEQFERLLRAIYRPQNFYCIHVDNKSSSDVHAAVRSIARCFENVFVLQQSFSVRWGTYSVLEPELACMQRLLGHSKIWKYFINLTGQEFPLKTNWQIVQILKAFNGSNNMEGTIKRRNSDRFVGKPAPPGHINVTKGSVHIVAVRGFVEYAIHNDTAKEFLDWVKDTGIPDETFFSSLNHNPQLLVPGAYLGEPETDNDKYRFITRFKNWGDGPFGWPCYGKRVSMVCVFSVGDLQLLAGRPELFANKFHLDYEPLALDCMEQLHYRRLRDEVRAGNAVQFDTSLYRAQEFVWNHV